MEEKLQLKARPGKPSSASLCLNGIFEPSLAKRERIMAFLSEKVKESIAAPRSRFIWAALVLFFIGSAICSFNPPADDGQKLIRGEQTMNSQSGSQANERTDLKSGVASSGIETATFALG
ncbi:MAG: hypothetical protein AB9866_12260 [Syntrophobacteraceae bacterium]